MRRLRVSMVQTISNLFFITKVEVVGFCDVCCGMSPSVEQSTTSPLLNLQIVPHIQKNLKLFLFGLSFCS